MNNNPSQTAVSVRNLSFSYRKRSILQDVDLTIKHGEYIGIIGPNGGGKTTLLRLLLAFLSPDKGEISLYGKPPKEARKEIGYVPQALHYDSSFPISTHELVIAGRLSHLPWWGRYSQIDRDLTQIALEKVGLSDKSKNPFSSLSGGQRQRALIARAIVNSPRLLLLDEPTANLDPESRDDIYALFDAFKGETTILMVTHDLRTVVDRVDSLLCVEQTVKSLAPTQICEHFALGIYHHPLLESRCTPPTENPGEER